MRLLLQAYCQRWRNLFHVQDRYGDDQQQHHQQQLCRKPCMVVSGGGIDGNVTLQNSIVANSSSGGNCSGTLTSKGYNLSSDDTCKFSGTGDLNNTDPKLSDTYRNYGGADTDRGSTLRKSQAGLMRATPAAAPGMAMVICSKLTNAASHAPTKRIQAAAIWARMNVRRTSVHEHCVVRSVGTSGTECLLLGDEVRAARCLGGFSFASRGSGCAATSVIRPLHSEPGMCPGCSGCSVVIFLHFLCVSLARACKARSLNRQGGARLTG